MTISTTETKPSKNPIKAKTTSKPSTVGALMLAVTALTASIANTAHANTAPEHHLVSLSVESSREVQNDQVQAVLYTELNEVEPSKLAKRVNEVINLAMAEAKKHPTVTVTTGNQSTYPIYNDKNQKIVSWRSRAEVQIKSTNFKSAGELIATLQSNMSLQNIQFNVSQDQRVRVENELVIEATQLFRARATALQNAWGANAYELVSQSVHTSANYNPQPYAAMADAVMLRSASSAVAPQEMLAGSTRLQISSNGTIQLK